MKNIKIKFRNGSHLLAFMKSQIILTNTYSMTNLKGKYHTENVGQTCYRCGNILHFQRFTNKNSSLWFIGLLVLGYFLWSECAVGRVWSLFIWWLASTVSLNPDCHGQEILFSFLRQLDFQPIFLACLVKLCARQLKDVFESYQCGLITGCLCSI